MDGDLRATAFFFIVGAVVIIGLGVWIFLASEPRITDDPRFKRIYIIKIVIVLLIFLVALTVKYILKRYYNIDSICPGCPF